MYRIVVKIVFIQSGFFFVIIILLIHGELFFLVELAMIMDRLYGGVCYAGIDTDPELKYPKGAGRVAFSNQQSYIAAISARFVQLQHGDIDKRVEVKPYVLDDQMCDECQGQRCGGKFAPFFCANVTCLQVSFLYCLQRLLAEVIGTSH